MTKQEIQHFFKSPYFPEFCGFCAPQNDIILSFRHYMVSMIDFKDNWLVTRDGTEFNMTDKEWEEVKVYREIKHFVK